MLIIYMYWDLTQATNPPDIVSTHRSSEVAVQKLWIPRICLEILADGSSSTSEKKREEKSRSRNSCLGVERSRARRLSRSSGSARWLSWTRSEACRIYSPAGLASAARSKRRRRREVRYGKSSRYNWFAYKNLFGCGTTSDVVSSRKKTLRRTKYD